jgi:hypothetical protein
MPADTLQLDKELLTALQSDPQYDYDREILSGGESLLEWLRRVINEWLLEHLDVMLDDDVANYILIGVGVLVILFLVFLYWRLRPKLFVRGAREEDLAYDVQEDTIYGVNFDADIAKALRAKDYRQAVRLVYLQTLLHLQNAEVINWQPSKTPVEYLRQVNHPDFTRMSHHFIRVRYGNFEATQALFEEMKELQAVLNSQFTIQSHD